MTPTSRLIDFIIAREGKRLRAYQCTNNVWTVGVGHTEGVKQGDVITDEICEAYLIQDLQKFMECVNARCPVYTENQFIAMVSLAFNIGVNGFQRSTVARQHNAGNYQDAADAFMLWVIPPELRDRREIERALYLDNAKD